MEIFMSIMGYIGAIGVSILSVPAIIALLKTRDTRPINIYMFIILFLACLGFVVSGTYGLLKEKDFANSGAQFSLAVTISNYIAGLNSAIVLIWKIVNIIKAKKRNLTENDYVETIVKKNK